jgi:hypothetical protein
VGSFYYEQLIKRELKRIQLQVGVRFYVRELGDIGVCLFSSELKKTKVKERKVSN